MADHYIVLGVKHEATLDEVKRAYRTLSRQHHPDKAAHLDDDVLRRSSERQMVMLNAAYHVLSSPRKRLQYDASIGLGQQAEMPPAPRNDTAPPARSSQSAARCFGVSSQPKPRYQLGAKYTQRSRQARRMDPGQYTTHEHGRAAEFQQGRPAAQPPAAAEFAPMRCEGEMPKPASWLRRDMDIARAWEQRHCPEPPQEEAYQWKKASGAWLTRIRERKQMGSEAATAGCGEGDVLEANCADRSQGPPMVAVA
eukprot:TRINITY_DN74225_c0_g1_i1.p1 TRINITY_DN74225_c0_g1~~TRINITY_DN74225_c0_g1_i1.p1  ORF type:complete len:253 (+),score=44.17 TRINITY_DN74225_c0_g1_i1:67-825(+)